MLYTLTGTLRGTSEGAFVVEIGGLGIRILTNGRTLERLPGAGATVTLYTRLYIREDQWELYGFLEEQTLKLFELLIGVSSVGPKTALGVLESDSVENLIAAILERRPELLTRAPGIGRKTAERVILELQNKVRLAGATARTEAMDLNAEVEDALVGLGYRRADVRRVLEKLDSKEKTLEERLRAALRALGNRT